MVTVIKLFITIYQDRLVCIERSSPFWAPTAARASTSGVAPMHDLYSAAPRARARAGSAVYVCCAFRYGEHTIGCHVGALGVMVAVGDRVYRDCLVCDECSSPFWASAAARASASGVAPMNDLHSAALRARARAGRAVYVCCAFRYGEHTVGFCVHMLGIMVVVRERATFVKSVFLGLDHDSAVVIMIRVRIVARAGLRHVCDTSAETPRLARITIPTRVFAT
jgi:hypothetical protein